MGIVLTIIGLVVAWQVFKRLTGASVVRDTHLFENEVKPFIYECLARGITWVEIPRKYVDATVTAHAFQKTRSIIKRGNNYLIFIQHQYTDEIWSVVIDGVSCEMSLASYEDIKTLGDIFTL